MPLTVTQTKTHSLGAYTGDVPRNGQQIAFAGAFPFTTHGLGTTAPPASTGATGAVGVASLAARSDHKHAAQAVSADVGNILAAGTDGLHKLTLASIISADAGNTLIVGTDGKLKAN